MTTYNISAECTATVTTPDGETHELQTTVTFDQNDGKTFADIQEEAAETMLEDWTEEYATPVTLTPDMVDIEITEYDDVPTDYHGTQEDKYSDLFTFLEAAAECDQDPEVICAALYLGIAPDDIDEAYSGEFSSDEDFAQDMAEQLGAIDRNAKWPQTCIDWEHAARELMYDYCEHNGHYFRNL